MLKIAVIVGTRPNFVKHYAFTKACREQNIDFVTIHTGQHNAPEMSQEFCQDLGLPVPEHHMAPLPPATPNALEHYITFIENALEAEKPNVVVVYGDVTSSRAGAIAATNRSIPIAHIEAGVHTDFRNNPEEINRRCVEELADVLFPHTQHAHASLLQANYDPKDVFLVGDIMKDTLLGIRTDLNLPNTNQGYILVTAHRAENTDSEQRLKNICSALQNSSADIIFPVHPRTENALKRYGLWQELADQPNITLLAPQTYTETIKLVCGAKKVVSDSGGLRREAYILGKPVISLIEMNWVPEMVDAGWEVIVGADQELIVDAIENFSPPTDQPDIFGDGKAADRIVGILVERYGQDTFNAGTFHAAPQHDGPLGSSVQGLE